MNEYGKRTDLAIKFTTSDTTIVVYTDMSKGRLENVPGVMRVYGILPDYSVVLDPRYDRSAVIRNIAVAAGTELEDVEYLK